MDPSNHLGFPEANWLIGNHSDELTPWLPILAVRSSERCRVFTIPCCSFSLFQKFNLGDHFRHRKQETYAKMLSDDSCCAIEQQEILDMNKVEDNCEGNIWRGRYRFYVRYLTEVFKLCGFDPEIDIMRIPSTKRVI